MDAPANLPIVNYNNELFSDAQNQLAWMKKSESLVFSSKILELHHTHSFQSTYLQSVDYLHEVSIQTRKPVCATCFLI